MMSFRRRGDPRGELRSVNLAAKFALELCSLAALGYWGASTGSGATSVTAAVAAPSAAAMVWGTFAAPRAKHRLRRALRIPLELSVFSLACASLAVAAEPAAAVGLAGAIAVNAVLLTMFDQWEG
jgi:hypothetical protein